MSLKSRSFMHPGPECCRKELLATGKGRTLMHIRGEEVYNYLFGRHFDLVSDHKSLVRLLSEKKPTFPQASARIIRWSLFLLRFEYTIKFRGTKKHANADALSRLPLPVVPKSEDCITRAGTTHRASG